MARTDSAASKPRRLHSAIQIVPNGAPSNSSTASAAGEKYGGFRSDLGAWASQNEGLLNNVGDALVSRSHAAFLTDRN